MAPNGGGSLEQARLGLEQIAEVRLELSAWRPPSLPVEPPHELSSGIDAALASLGQSLRQSVQAALASRGPRLQESLSLVAAARKRLIHDCTCAWNSICQLEPEGCAEYLRTLKQLRLVSDPRLFDTEPRQPTRLGLERHAAMQLFAEGAAVKPRVDSLLQVVSPLDTTHHPANHLV